MPSFFIKLQYFIYLVMKMNLLNRTQNLFVFLYFVKGSIFEKIRYNHGNTVYCRF